MAIVHYIPGEFNADGSPSGRGEMGNSSLSKKLFIRPGQRLLVLNAPPHYAGMLGVLPDDVRIAASAEGEADHVQVFVHNLEELKALAPVALSALIHDGIFWVMYPKKSSKIKSDLNRDKGWEIITDTGMRPVMMVSIDETWSALRFRPVDKVGK